MEQLEEKIKALIKLLESIKELPNPNIDKIREQIYAIENVELLKLEEEFLKLRERDDIVELPLEYIGDRLLYANALVDMIYEKFGFEYADEKEDVGELIRMPLKDKEYYAVEDPDV